MVSRKRNDGRKLESIVTYIESLRLPEGWTITPRVLRKSEAGGTGGELDILLKGKVGTIDLTWLIECRDRPSAGPAPASWIEQLYGRRHRYNLSKVTAVSTTGFSRPALELASKLGIDTREFRELSCAEFKSWPELVGMMHRTDLLNLQRVEFGVNTTPATHTMDSLAEAMQRDQANQVLRELATNDEVTPLSIFKNTLDRHPELLEGLQVNGPALPISFDVTLNDSHVLDTAQGPVAIALLRFTGSLLRTEESRPLAFSGKYSRSQTGEEIGHLRMYEPHDVLGLKLQTEIHESPDVEGATIVLRHIVAPD